MEYLIGVALAVGVGLFATRVGLERDRAFYPGVLIVIASYYDLFAVMGQAPAALPIETASLLVFIAMAVIGFRSSLWWVVAALFGHGVFDLVHPRLVENPGAPSWWPMFCLAYDVAAGAIWPRGCWRRNRRDPRVDGRDVEAFRGMRRDEVAGDQIELLIAGREGVIARGVSSPRPRPADVIGDVEMAQFMVGSDGLHIRCSTPFSFRSTAPAALLPHARSLFTANQTVISAKANGPRNQRTSLGGNREGNDIFATRRRA